MVKMTETLNWNVELQAPCIQPFIWFLAPEVILGSCDPVHILKDEDGEDGAEMWNWNISIGEQDKIFHVPVVLHCEERYYWAFLTFYF